MKLKRLVFLAILAIAPSCTPLITPSVVGKMVLDGTIRPTKNASDIEVLLEIPTKGFKDIVIIEMSDDGLGLGLEIIKKSFAIEAAKLGGDAVIVSRKKDVMLFSSTGNTNSYEGRVIVYTSNP